MARGQVAPQLLPALLQVAHFGAVLGGTVERGAGHLLVRDGDAEAGAELAQLVLVQLLLLVGDVLAFAGLAQAVALGRHGQDDGRLPLVLHGLAVGGVDLVWIVPAPLEGLELVVGHVLDHLGQAGVGPEEVLAQVASGADHVLLEVAVHHFVHPAQQHPVVVAGQQGVPGAGPDHLDHVPAGAAEGGLQLLDDLAVAAHRAVQALQVAVDHEDQVVQLLAAGQGDGAQGFRLVGLAVPHEAPDLRADLLLQAAILQVADEAGLVDGLDGAQPHADGGKLPEVRHQPGVGVGGQAPGQLATEGLQLLAGQATLQEGARVDARRGVPLEEDQVAITPLAAPAEEVVEGHLVQGGRRGVGRDVPAQPVELAVGAHHHGHRVPADEALDAALDVPVAGIGGLLFDRDRVDVGRVGGEREAHPAPLGIALQEPQQVVDPIGTLRVQDVLKRVDPLLVLQFLGFRGSSRVLAAGQIQTALPGEILEHRGGPFYPGETSWVRAST